MTIRRARLRRRAPRRALRSHALAADLFFDRGALHQAQAALQGTQAARARGELARGRIEGGAIGLIASPTLAYNTGATPGFSFHDVVLTDNEVDYQQTESELPSPGAILF